MVKDAVSPLARASSSGAADLSAGIFAEVPPASTESPGKPFRVHRSPLLVSVTGMLPVSPAAVAAFAGPTWIPVSPIAQAATAAFFAEPAVSPDFPEPPASPEPPSQEVRARAAARTVTAMGRARMGSPGSRDDVHGSS